MIMQSSCPKPRAAAGKNRQPNGPIAIPLEPSNRSRNPATSRDSGGSPRNQPKLLDRIRAEARTRHYSIRTERTYVDRAYRYILFHDKRHPATLGAADINRFLSYLAVDLNVAAGTQNQALNAILFMYKHVLKKRPS